MPLVQVQQESATLSASDALAAIGYAVGRRPKDGRKGWETALATVLGGPAVAVASCRGALALALRASGLDPARDEVIVTGFTCVAVPAGVLAGGGRPRYADIDASTGNMTAESVVRATTERTGAVIVQHFLGNPAPTRAIRDASEASTWIIEDAAHALGSRIDGGLVGTHGDWAVFSTEQSKSLSTGQGGVLIAISERARQRLAGLAALDETWTAKRTRRWLVRVGLERLAFGATPFGRLMPGQMLVRVLHRTGLASISSRDDEEVDGGMPAWRLAALPDPLAELGLRQLGRLEAIIAHRRSIAARYDETLAGVGRRLATTAGAEPVWLRYPVLVDDAEMVAPAMADRGWGLGGRWFDAPIYPADTNGPAVGYEPGTCPEAERLSGRIINLPTHPLVTTRLADRLAADLRTAIGG